jgi:hypothetical protein
MTQLLKDGSTMIFKFFAIVFILLNIASNTVYAADCRYASKDVHPEEVSSQGNCVKVMKNDFLRLKQSHVNRLSFSENGLAWVMIGNKVFSVAKNGKTMRTHYYDNGPDYFEEGLARTILNGKFGFMDERLKIVIKPSFDFAFPFENGHAIVCNGCRIYKEGEHQTVTGGKWGVINRQGELIIPPRYRKDDLMRMSEFSNLGMGAGH